MRSVNVPDVPETTSAEEMLGITSSSAGALNRVVESLASTAETGTERDQSRFREEILSSLDELSGRGTRQSELEQEADIPGQRERLQELTNQLLALDTESKAIPLRTEEELEGRVSRGVIERESRKRVRQNAIKALTVSAQAQALQGSIALAQSQVDRAITLEFEPKEQRLQYLAQAYEFVREDLQREDKERADRLGFLIDERNRLLEQEKDERKQIFDMSLEVAQGGASNLVVQNIQNAKSFEEAIRIAAENNIFTEQMALREETVGGFRVLRDASGDVISTRSADGGGGGDGDGGGERVTITAEDRRILTGAGFTPDQITDLHNAVNDFGIDAVLENVDDAQKKRAIREVYHVQQKVTRAQVEDSVTLKVAQEGLKDTYTDSELKELAREKGYTQFFGLGTDVDDFLASEDARQLYIDLLIEQYRNAGLFSE